MCLTRDMTSMVLNQGAFDNYGGVAQLARASRKHPESSSFVGLRGMCLIRDMTSMVLTKERLITMAV